MFIEDFFRLLKFFEIFVLLFELIIFFCWNDVLRGVLDIKEDLLNVGEENCVIFMFFFTFLRILERIDRWEIL